MVNGKFPESFYNIEKVPFPVSFKETPFICTLGIAYFTQSHPGWRAPVTLNPHNNQNTIEVWDKTSVNLCNSYSSRYWEYLINYQLFLGI